MLFRFKKVNPLCSYCNEEEETLLHLFHSCLKTKQLWNKLRQYCPAYIFSPDFPMLVQDLGKFQKDHCLHATRMHCNVCLLVKLQLVKEF